MIRNGQNKKQYFDKIALIIIDELKIIVHNNFLKKILSVRFDTDGFSIFSLFERITIRSFAVEKDSFAEILLSVLRSFTERVLADRCFNQAALHIN